MAKVCSVCGKGKVSGNQVSHSNRHSRRTWSANLRSVRAIIGGTPKRVKVCTRCLRSGKVERALYFFNKQSLLIIISRLLFYLMNIIFYYFS